MPFSAVGPKAAILPCWFSNDNYCNSEAFGQMRILCRTNRIML